MGFWKPPPFPTDLWPVVDNLVSSLPKKAAPDFLTARSPCRPRTRPQMALALCSLRAGGQAQGTKDLWVISRLVWKQTLIHLWNSTQLWEVELNGCPDPAQGGFCLHGRFIAVPMQTRGRWQHCSGASHSALQTHGAGRNTSSLVPLTPPREGQSESDLMALPQKKVLVSLRI